VISHSPAETYIRYLLIHPRKYTEDQVKEVLSYAQLDFLGGWYLKKLKSEMRPPDPFRPFERSHGPSRLFLLRSGLSWIFTPDEHGKKAFRLLELPRAREFVEAMLLSRAPHASIAARLARVFDFECTETAIARYKSFFWDVDLLDSTQMRALLELRAQQLGNHKDPEIAAQAAAMKKPLFTDARKLAADMPFTPLAALSTQVRMGIYPGKLEQGKLLDQASGVLMLRVLEAGTQDNYQASNRALNYAMALGKVMEARDKIANPEDDIQEQLQRIVFRTDEAPLPTVGQLLGSRTIEVAVVESSTTQSVPLTEVEGVEDGDDFEP
jgi:hypothetical protein